jgi:transcriptional regulator with XRE-family HTH domain
MVSPSRRTDAFVGERIRDRRTVLGITQEQLAAALGISYQQVQKYETGANRVSAGRLFEIARALNVDVGHFYSGISPDAEPTPLEHGGKARSTIELVKNFSDIGNGDVRSAISNLVKTLAKRVEG